MDSNMGLVKFGDYVKEVKINIDRNNNPYEYYVAGDHMDSEDLTIRRKGLFATDDVGPAFTRLFKPGQILYGSRRTYLKKVAVADFEGICSNTTFVLETKDDNKLRQRLLPFIMLTDDFTKWSISKSKGSTNPYILFSDLANYEFELPDINRQDELVNLLWQAYATKESYREMIRATDEMVKSQFIEQFGFPQDGAEKYPSVTIESLLQETISGEWGTDCSDDSGTKVIRTTNFTNEGVLDLTDVVVRTIDAKKVEKKQLKKGDIILEKSGGTKDNPVGRLVYFEEDGVFLANNFTQVLRPAEDINSRYLFAALYYLYQTHKSLIKGLGNQTNGIQNLKVPQYLQLQISVPDRTAQDDFERICRQADKSKFELKQAIEKIDKVMRALMQ
jgi:type I restriction enzyme S subunit